MSEQFFVFASQMSILSTTAAVVSLYAGIVILNVIGYVCTKLKELVYTVFRRAHGVRTHVVQIQSTNSNTKVKVLGV